MDCIAFLQWALPQLSLSWPGFRKVRGQVCKRIRRRTECLGLEGLAAYRDYLDRHHQEWTILDGFFASRFPASIATKTCFGS